MSKEELIRYFPKLNSESYTKYDLNKKELNKVWEEISSKCEKLREVFSIFYLFRGVQDKTYDITSNISYCYLNKYVKFKFKDKTYRFYLNLYEHSFYFTFFIGNMYGEISREKESFFVHPSNNIVFTYKTFGLCFSYKEYLNILSAINNCLTLQVEQIETFKKKISEFTFYN